MSIIHLRAKTLAKIRAFFAKRNIVEVETPLLSHATNPSPHLNSFNVNDLYLQTSPEFAMKRLLAAGSGDIYQICKAFRQGELGRLHNPEFTILEWYRVGFNHHDLMAEVDEFLQTISNTLPAKQFTYAKIFTDFCHINPHTASIKQLKAIAQDSLSIINLPKQQDEWLQLLFTHLIEPQLGFEHPVFIYDFPPAQAMLAKIRPENPRVASRFEVYYKGIELFNGFHELNDCHEQRKRLAQDLTQRQQLNLPAVPLDQNFLAALPNLPDCSGVACGIDRLLLLISATTSLNEVLCYPFAEA